MASLISFAVPEEFKARVTAFCKERQQVPGQLSITLVDPSLLGKMSGLEQKLQLFCLAQSDVNLVLGGPGAFNNQLLYLSVLPGLISIVRSKLLAHLKIEPDNKVYRPHLTILRAQPGMKIEMQRLTADAQSSFSEPYTFTANAFELYEQNGDNTPFKHKATIPFTGR